MLAIVAMAAALVAGILPDPWGTALPLVFVAVLILALYLRFQNQARRGGSPLPPSARKGGPVSPGEGAGDLSSPAQAFERGPEAPRPGGDREV